MPKKKKLSVSKAALQDELTAAQIKVAQTEAALGLVEADTIGLTAALDDLKSRMAQAVAANNEQREEILVLQSTANAQCITIDKLREENKSLSHRLARAYKHLTTVRMVARVLATTVFVPKKQ